MPIDSRLAPSPHRSLPLRLLATTLLVGFASADEPAPAALGAKIEALVKAHKGKAAVALKHLETGATYSLAADQAMPTASLIKFPVMIEAYRQAAEGKIRLDAPVVLRESDKVPGSGILTSHFSAGASFPLVDAVHLMITYSDNTATNLVLDAIGIGSTAATMEAMGFPNTKIHSKVYRRDTSVFPERSKVFGLGSTTAADMIALFERLHARKIVDEAASEAMWKHLLTCDDKAKFPKFLPRGTKIAFKTGSVDDSRTCAGVIETKGGPVALCVLTTENEDQSWGDDNAGDLLCARIAREVYDFFSLPAESAEPKPVGAAAGE